MAEITYDVTILLDRLYNLTGEDNVIIKETEERIASAEQKVEEIASSIEDSRRAQEDKERILSMFMQQKELFEQTFDGITDETFSALRGIGVDLDLGTVLSTVQSKSPEYIELLMRDIDDKKKAIESLEEEKNNVLSELVALKEELVAHNDRRNQLRSLLEQSLSDYDIERESLTASFVKKILSAFGVFNADEISRLTKLIMFPDEGLFEFDHHYEDRLSKGIVGLVEEDEEIVPTQSIIEDEPVVEGQDVVLTFAKPQETIDENPIDIEELSKPVQPSPEPGEEVVGPPIVLSFQQLNADENLYHPIKANGSKEEPVEVSEVVITTDSEPKEGVAPLTPLGTEEAFTSLTPIASEESKEKPVGVLEPTGELTVEETAILGMVTPAELGREAIEVDEEPEDVLAEQPIAEETIDYTEIENMLTRLGFDLSQFKEHNAQPIDVIYKAVSEVDETIINTNFEILRSINLASEAYKMRFGHMYITDVDFNKKITLLRVKNITESKIQNLIKNTNSGLRVSYEELEKRIQAVESLHGKIDDTNIYLISKDVAKYEENLDLLLSHGIDIDDKESRNHTVLLFDSLNITPNVEILKQYIISILKSNGKYALSVFWKSPGELLLSIDDLIEAGLENIIATHPEVLGASSDQLLRRISYCEEQKQPVFTDSLKSEPCDYITRPDKFHKKYGYVELPELVDRARTNAMLSDIIGNQDYVEILTNTLEDYYSTSESYEIPEIDESMRETYEDLCHYLEENAHAELAGKYTYKVADVAICKNKLERNIAVILNAMATSNQPTTGVEREIVLVSALYNSRFTAEQLKKVADSCLGFNVNAQEVITL